MYQRQENVIVQSFGREEKNPAWESTSLRTSEWENLCKKVTNLDSTWYPQKSAVHSICNGNPSQTTIEHGGIVRKVPFKNGPFQNGLIMFLFFVEDILAECFTALRISQIAMRLWRT